MDCSSVVVYIYYTCSFFLLFLNAMILLTHACSNCKWSTANSNHSPFLPGTSVHVWSNLSNDVRHSTTRFCFKNTQELAHSIALSSFKHPRRQSLYYCSLFSSLFLSLKNKLRGHFSALNTSKTKQHFLSHPIVRGWGVGG